MRPEEQPKDDAEAAQEVHVQDVHDPTVETNAIHVVVEVAYEVVQPYAPVADEVVYQDAPVGDEVTATYQVPSITTDIEVTSLASTKSSMHTNGEFSGGFIDRSVLTEYVDHVVYRL